MPIDDESDNKDHPGIKDLISLKEASEACGVSQSHLSLLIRKGELWGIKIGRDWLTTEKAVREYLSRGLKPGPKPGKTPK